ncbi:MAG: response regulator transcription factor [Candidatus Melainabacteria bacterium]|uniref:Response regulator transcription factor n=1 Tax=Candidatus Obscuribacter phosphatis TaxID=1906157 RepID=A0A8J7PAE6_9BACT|nr:response regulator transcription factor [Candidatus Obscuribacter phosphatis]MBX9940111.1 response regulator transcription factor [Candidatus Obscuribacterales bacterium]MCA0315407.1 response regulator transcription factor [Candidatus Melainabacteria bacterium]
MAKILIVEDDVQLAELVMRWLGREGHLVEHVKNGGDALQRLRFDPYDLIVLDWNLPEVEGIDILKTFRRNGGTTPVLMLTGKKAIEEKLEGLGQGADDYLTKPFDGRELTARIAVLLRRPTVLLPIDVLKVGDIELDAKAHKVTRGGSLVSLLPKEFALLEFFMRNAGQYFPAEKLLAHVWPSESDSTVEALTSCIKRLRQKIDYSGSESVIKNVRGAGYGLFVENQNS